MNEYDFNKEYKEREKLLKKAAKNNDNVGIGTQLYWIRKNRKNITLLEGYANIYDYAMDLIGMKRTSSCNTISVVDTFGEKDKNGYPTGTLKVKYRKFDFSQLIEMRQLDKSQMDRITPEMSVRQIKTLHMPVKEKTTAETIAEITEKLSKNDQDRLLRIAKTLLDAENAPETTKFHVA